MANLQDTQVQNLDVLGNLTAGGPINRANNPVVSATKNNGGSTYSTLGAVPFNNILCQTSGITPSNNNSRFTVNEDGLYHACFYNIGTPGGQLGRAYIRKNGSTSGDIQARSDDDIDWPVCYAMRIFSAVAGDYFELHLTAGSMYMALDHYTNFTIFKVG